MASLLGGETSFHKVEGAGHSANLEKPKIVNPILLDFLASL